MSDDEQSLEELLVLPEEMQRLRVANEQLRQGGGARAGTSNNGTNAGGTAPSGDSTASQPILERLIYIQNLNLIYQYMIG